MSKMIVPVNNWNGNMTSAQDYGWRTLSGQNVFHRGVDMGSVAGVKSGSPVYAAAPGVVTQVGYGEGTGNYCIIEHNFSGQKVYTYYAHFKSSPSVKKGEQVNQSQLIGYVGNTGDSYGAHLHFEIQVGSFSFNGYSKNAGNSVNPMEWITVGQDQSKHPNGGYGLGSKVPTNSEGWFVPPSSNHKSAQYAKIINEAAQAYDFDPYLIAAIIQVESNWNPEAGSHAGALGLMQLMPATARDVGLDDSALSRLNPRNNIMYGTKYLRDIVINRAKVGTNTEDVLRGYNMGPYGYAEVKRIGSASKSWNAYNSAENKAYYGKVKKAYEELKNKTLPSTVPPFAGTGSPYDGGSSSLGGLDIATGDDEIGRQLAHTNQPSRINGVSPSPLKDNYPKHRYGHNPFVLRIGDSQFYIPPINIQHHKVGASYSVPTMRNRTSMLQKSGWTEGTLMIQLMFADIDQINGYKVEAPDDTHYYMDGVRSLVAQFHKNPMLPIRNEYINNGLGIFNVIIEDIQLSTVPELPNVLNVTIIARECVTKPYTGTAEFAYDMCFNYPIWRWFYQNLLVDEESKRMESVYLRPIDGHMRNTFLVRTIDDAEVTRMQEDLMNEANLTVRNFNNTEEEIPIENDAVNKINPQYLLSRFTGANIRTLMSEWDLGEVHVQSIQGSISKQLSRVNMAEYEAPIFQDLGGMNKVFDVHLKLTSREQVNQLQTLVRIVEEVAREYRHMFVGGFIEIHNDIINMCGVDFCMIEEVTCSTTPVNGVFDATMRLREYNPNQSNHESLQGIKTDIHRVTDEWIKNNGELAERTHTAHKNDRYNTVNEEYLIETLIKQMELYPDLRLPSIPDANRMLKIINDWRAEKGYELVPFQAFPSKEDDIWVEPDFYFMYPTPDDVYASIGMKEFGDKLGALFTTGDYDGFIQDTHIGTTPYHKMSIAAGMQELVTSFTGREASNHFNVEDNDYYRVQTATQFTYPNKPVYTEFFKEWHSDMQMPEPSVLASLMLYDQVNYDQRYRLNRFFPTYMMLFVDEGQWIDGRRLWNTHYAYHAIHEMTVTKDKNNPVDTAYIRLSNMYGTFNSDSKLKEPKEYFKYNPTADGVWEYVKDLYEAWHFTARDLMVDAKRMMEHASLEVGARIHLRMGNSSNTSNLPTVFNGQITSVNDGVDIEIFAQGDGVELASGPISGNKGDSSPAEPHNALQKYMTKRQSNYWFTVASDLEFFYNYESLYGIEHFGWVQSKDSSDTGVSEWFKAVMADEETMKVETSSMNILQRLGNWIGNSFSFITNVIDATWDNFPSLLEAHSEYIVGEITDTPTFVVYDVMKNIFRGRVDLASTGVIFGDSSTNTAEIGGNTLIDGFKFQDGELNVTLSEMNKTVWDIGTALSLFVPDFIFAVHPHGLRSTVFFGMPHWLVKFRYQKPNTGEDSLLNWKEEVKPFQQAHIINTQVDLIHNGIRASAELLRHEQTALYSMGDASNTKESMTVYADKSILSDQRKRDVVDTGVLQDLFGPDSLINGMMTIVSGVVGITAGAANFAIDAVEGLLDYFGVKNNLGILHDTVDTVDEWTRYFSRSGQEQAKQVAIGNMQRNFMEMYQGEVVLLGQGSIKPWDIFYMDDTRKMMSGTAQVGQVTHTLSRSTGFMTVIKPDLIVTRVRQEGRRNEALKSAMQFATFGGLNTLRITSRINGLDWLASGTYKKTKTLAIKTAQGIDNVSNRFGGIKVFDAIRDYIDERADVDNKKNDANNNNDVDLDAPEGRLKNLVNKSFKMLKRNLMTLAIAGVAEEMFSRWWDKKTRYNNVIYIHPLMKAGVPFTAGVKGALHIIPNYVDDRYVDIDKLPGNENRSSGGSGGSSSGSNEPLPESTVATIVSVNLNEHLDGAGAVKEIDKSIMSEHIKSANDADSSYRGSNQVPSLDYDTYLEYAGSPWTAPNVNGLEEYAVVGNIVHPAMDLTQVSVKTTFDIEHYRYGVTFAFNKDAKDKAVCSIAKGKVVYAQNVSGKGMVVVIEHASGGLGNTYYSAYYGLKVGSLKVKRGELVKKGERIGTAGGFEGQSKNLFEVQIHISSYTSDDKKSANGSRVNPVDFFKKAGVKIS